MGVVDSVALATGTSGNAVTFAGMTVIIALAALLVTGIPFLGIMGLVAAGTVLVAVLIAITLTPAMLGLLGNRVLGRQGRSGRGPRHRASDDGGAATTPSTARPPSPRAPRHTARTT
jgi:RND superfamily putative drug exporter